MRVGRYEYSEMIGGTIATVYAARDTRTRRRVAVKILPRGHDAEVLKRFQREARLMRNCPHRNVVRTLDDGEYKGQHYLVMEFLEGSSIRDLARARITSVEQSCWVALQIARGLRHLHSVGIIHRDIKPANVMVAPNLDTRIVDLGVARLAGSTLTVAGQRIGTPRYMAPEQVIGAQATPATDVYAFGMILFELLTFEYAYGSSFESETDVYVAVQTANPRLELLAGVDSSLAAMVSRCLNKEPAERYQDFEEIIFTLERLIPAAFYKPEMPVVAARRTDWTGLRPSMIRAATVLAACAAVAVIGWWGYAMLPGLPPVVRQPEGDMVLVAGGEAMLGTPPHRVNVPAVYIDRTEVSAGAYRQFCEKTGYPKPPDLDAADPETPVVNVTIEDARAFAAWAGKRLPTPEEWEKAARGTDGRLFPWGNEPRPDFVNIQFDNASAVQAKLEPVRARQNGASPFGLLNMVGNAWEWVDGPATPTPEELAILKQSLGRLSPPISLTEQYFQIRGGGAGDPRDPADLHRMTVEPGAMPARARYFALGFRCARTPRFFDRWRGSL